VMASGSPAAPRGLNLEGLKRRGFTKESQRAILNAYKAIFRKSLTIEEANAELAESAKNDANVKMLVDFVNHSARGIIR